MPRPPISLRLTGRPVAHNQLDVPWVLSVLPTSGEGWLGTPAYAAHRAGSRAAPRWVATLRHGDGEAEVRATASDVGVDVVVRYRLDGHGVLVVESSLTNASSDGTPLDVAALLRRSAVAGPRRRGARPHRALVPGTLAAASTPGRRHLCCVPDAVAARVTTRRC